MGGVSLITINVKIVRLVWSSTGNDFKIYGAYPSDESDILRYNLKLNAYNNLTLNGVMPKLEVGRVYKAQLIEKKHPKFGVGYEVQHIYNEIPSSVEEQKAYLMTLLTENQVEAIYSYYSNGEDIISLMKNNTFDYEKISGIGEYTYNRIRAKIIDNLELQEALVSLSKFGLTYNVISKLVKKYGSASLVVEKIEKNPYVLTEVDGIGFIKADEYALNMGIEKDSANRIYACISYVLDKSANDEGHSWIYKKELLSKCYELLKIDKKIIIKSIKDLSNDDTYITNEEKIAKRFLYNYEKNIKKSLLRLLNHKPKKIDNVDERICKSEEKQGFKFTDEQKESIKKAIENNVIVVTGKAGTGKTTILKAILDVIGDDGEYKEYFTCALSGKASQRIAESTGLKSSTIHRLLEFDRNSMGFKHNEENKLEKGVVVIDEASMTNSYIFYSLISAIETGSKFIILGDTEQLEPIGTGNVFKDIVESGVIPVAFLTQVHRQAMKSGILKTANEVREGRQFNGKNDFDNRVIGELKDLHLRPFREAENVKKTILKVCKQYSKVNNFDIMNFQVIVPMKNRGDICTKNINIELQKIFNGEEKPSLSRNGFDFKEGDKIIQNGNNYDDDVFNGTLGIIKNIDTEKKEVVIDFIGSDRVTYTQEQMGQIELAYCLTVHRVQGSQFDNVVIGLDYSSYVLLSRQLLYTALTRASKLCILAFENRALRYAVRTDKASIRNTFLKDMLMDNSGSIDK